MEKIIEIKGYFSVEELSSIFDVNEETVRRWIRSGKLKSFMSSKREGNVVSSDDVSAFCASFKPQYKSKWIAYCKQIEDPGQTVHWKTKHDGELIARQILMGSYERWRKIRRMSNDLISRKDAIDWVQNILAVDRYYHPHSKSRNVPLDEVIDSLERVPSIDAEPQWTPCSERLPEEDDVYLVTVHPDYAPQECKQVDRMYYFKGEWLWLNEKAEWEKWPDPIIAWMPLPEPYKEERKES